MNNLITPKPHIIRAYYDWMVDNNLTPHIHILLDTTMEGLEGVEMPSEYRGHQNIVFNISDKFIDRLIIDNDYIAFNTKKKHYVKIPLNSIKSIFPKEFGRDTEIAFNRNKHYTQKKHETFNKTSIKTFSYIPLIFTILKNDSLFLLHINGFLLIVIGGLLIF